MRKTGFLGKQRFPREKQDQEKDQAQPSVRKNGHQRQGNQGMGVHKVFKVREDQKSGQEHIQKSSGSCVILSQNSKVKSKA